MDITQDGPFRKLSELIGLVQTLGIVPAFAGIILVSNAVSLWPAAVALLIFGFIISFVGFLLSKHFFRGWEEIVDFEPQGYRIALQLNRFGREEVKDED